MSTTPGRAGSAVQRPVRGGTTLVRMKSERGSFVVLEGADGCGKSTQAARLAEALRVRGTTVMHTRDPGGTPLSDAIRGILLDGSAGEVTPRAETLLFMAARAQLAERVIAPALARGETVVCERWTLSTEVYQGSAGGVGVRTVGRLAAIAEGAAAPDLVIVLDVPIGEGLVRVGSERDRMESKGGPFHARVVKTYRRLARRRRHHVLLQPQDAEATAVRVLEEVLAHVA